MLRMAYEPQGEQPGLADPYHVLHLIYNELGDGKKARCCHQQGKEKGRPIQCRETGQLQMQSCSLLVLLSNVKCCQRLTCASVSSDHQVTEDNICSSEALDALLLSAYFTSPPSEARHCKSVLHPRVQQCLLRSSSRGVRDTHGNCMLCQCNVCHFHWWANWQAR